MRAPAPSAEALRFLRLLWQPGEVREVRIPHHNRYGHTASGYFSSPEAAAAAVAAWDGRASLDVTLSPVEPALLARAAERIVPKAEHTTSDSEVTARRWFIVDVDPLRPSGISSSAGELDAARAVCRAAMEFLAERGWPDPLVIMSGNGYHLLYRVDLRNDAASRALVQSVLAVLAERCDTRAAHVDTAVANAARLTALVGTLKVKGDPISDRPRRRVALECVPEQLVPNNAVLPRGRRHAGCARTAGDVRTL